MRLRLPLLVLLVAVALLMSQWAPAPRSIGPAPGGLPPEAVQTLRLIERGGPFPHRQDGTVFQNRERLLPQRPQGYYREYTVPTPGARDRGARRIVTGGDPPEVFYYTEDHYRSFREIEGPR
jgi:ribonuclease T1